MPALVAALGKVFVWALSFFIGKLIIGLGIGFIVFEGIDVGVAALQNQIAQASNLSEYYSEAAQVLGFYDALNIIISAYTARFATGTAYKLAMRKAS